MCFAKISSGSIACKWSSELTVFADDDVGIPNDRAEPFWNNLDFEDELSGTLETLCTDAPDATFDIAVSVLSTHVPLASREGLDCHYNTVCMKEKFRGRSKL